MVDNLHLKQTLLTAGRPLEEATAAVIAVHGRARDPQDILDTCCRLGVEDVAYLAPAAHDSNWYPNGFMVELEKNEPGISHTMERIDTLLNELLVKGFSRDRIALVGFSQGACACAEYVIRHPARYGGVIIFTGGVIGPATTSWDYPGVFSATPVLISGSSIDEWVQVERMQETAELMRNKGADVREYYYPGTEHIVNDQEIESAREIILSLC